MGWMKYHDEWHLEECLVNRSKYSKLKKEYERRWLRYCRTCMGVGRVPYTENVAGHGDPPIHQSGDDPCPDCIMEGKCPRCATSLMEYFEDVLLKSGRLPRDAYKGARAFRKLGIAAGITPAIEMFGDWVINGEKCPICQGIFPKDALGHEPECFCHEQPPPTVFPVVGWTVTNAQDHDRTYACIIRGYSSRLYMNPSETALSRLRRVAEGRGWSLSLYISEHAVMLYWTRPDVSLERPKVWL